MKLYAALAAVLLVNFASSYPASESSSTQEIGLVYASDKPDAQDEKVQNDEPIPPLQLKSMVVNSNVTNRYAHTVICSKFANPANTPQEATFSVVLPDTGFISGFVMEIKGKQYKAYVEEKKEAKRIYNEAVASGLGAAHVEADARDSNRFTVSVNVEAKSKVVFNLTYEQLLVRRHGKYEMVINLHPGQLVKDLRVDVFLNETKRLLKVATPALRSGNEIVSDNEKKNEYAEVKVLNEDYTTAHIHFAPTVEQQIEMAKILDDKKPTDRGISGQFVIEYDVERDPTGGQILVSDDGYFVHFFAPDQLKPIPKHVVFVLDVSGSMHGRKLEQVKEAMQVILGQLTPEDYFNLVEFSSGAKVWNLENTTQSPTFETTVRRYGWWRPEDAVRTENQELPPAFKATPENIKIAKDIIEKMYSNGGTNLYDALGTAVNITTAGVDVENAPRPIIIFLTDGEATDGETDSNKIVAMVDEGNTGENKAALFTLAFGSDANKEFLKKISLKNNGFMRHIYEAADASLQLQDFYKTISSPLLANVKFNYPATESLTKHNFHTLFEGGELIVSGKMVKVDEKPEDFKVSALTVRGPIDFPPQIIKWVPRPVAIGELERLWAYMSIRQLLDKATAKDQKESDEKKKALELALKYSFVTPVTSLVVVKPNETKSVETEEAHSADKNFEGYKGHRLGGPVLGLPISALSGLTGGGGFFSMPQSASVDIRFESDSLDAVAPAPSLPYPITPGAYRPPATNAPRTTTFRPPTTEQENIAHEEHEDLSENPIVTDLPWLKAIIVPGTADQIVVDNRTYQLGGNGTVVGPQPCVSPRGSAGNCTLLSSCPGIHPRLTDLAAYKHYFCSLESDKYAGVCCVEE